MSAPERPAPDPFSLALGRIEGHLEGIEKRFDAVDRRFDGIDKRLDGMERRLDGVETRMATRAELRAYMTVILLAFAALFAAVLRHGG